MHAVVIQGVVCYMQKYTALIVLLYNKPEVGWDEKPIVLRTGILRQPGYYCQSLPFKSKEVHVTPKQRETLWDFMLQYIYSIEWQQNVLAHLEFLIPNQTLSILILLKSIWSH